MQFQRLCEWWVTTNIPIFVALQYHKAHILYHITAAPRIRIRYLGTDLDPWGRRCADPRIKITNIGINAKRGGFMSDFRQSVVHYNIKKLLIMKNINFLILYTLIWCIWNQASPISRFKKYKNKPGTRGLLRKGLKIPMDGLTKWRTEGGSNI